MAKIDTSKIDGFGDMTAEQKLSAILGLDVPDEVDMSLYVTKETADKYASEAAGLKKQLRAKMSDEEAAKLQAENERAELQQKYDALLRESTVAKYKSRYLAQGYDEKLAEDTAEALANGDAEKVFANGEKFKAEMEKKIRADVLKGTPRPGSANNGGAALSRADISKIKDPVERQRAIAENLNLYEKE